MGLIPQGVALFGFIPLVLFLYLKIPFGAGPSLAIGVCLMLSHRFIAGPWMRRHATERCLWCGMTGEMPERFNVAASDTEIGMAACSPSHARLAGRFLTFVSLRRRIIATGIFVPLLVLLAGTAAEAFGRPFLSHETNAFQFRLLVAITVIGASRGYLSTADPSFPLASPFPLHNLFLLGIRNILWVFRIVGFWWLALTASILAGSDGPF